MVASMVFVSLLAKSNIRASDGYRNGSECQPASAADAADLVYNQYGVQNMSTATHRNVICPIPSVYGGDTTVGIRAYDRNNVAVGSTNNVNCNAVSMTIDGDINYSINLSTSSSGPAAQVAELTLFDLPAQHMWQFQCSIPRIVTPGQISHFLSYWLFSYY